MPKPRILFLCVANSCRSQMAEALARHRLGARFEIYSAGSAPTRVDPRAIQVLKERGLDTSPLFTKSVAEVPREVEYAISLCAEQELSCPVFPARTRRLAWPTPDPARATGSEQEIVRAFRNVRDAIDRRIACFAGSV